MQLVDDILIVITNDIFQYTPMIKVVSKFFVGYFKSPRVHADLLVDYTKWERHVRNYELYPYKEAIMLMANLHPGADFEVAIAQWQVICDWPEQPPPTPSVINTNSRRFFSLFKHSLDTGKLFLWNATQLMTTLKEVFHLPLLVCDLHHMNSTSVLRKRLPFACMKSLPDFSGTVHLTSSMPACPGIQLHFKLDDPYKLFPDNLLIRLEVVAFEKLGDNKYGACLSRSASHHCGFFGKDTNRVQGYKLISEFNLPEDTILTYQIKRYLVHAYNIAHRLPNAPLGANAPLGECSLPYYLERMGETAAQEFIESATIGPYAGGQKPEDTIVTIAQ